MFDSALGYNWEEAFISKILKLWYEVHVIDVKAVNYIKMYWIFIFEFSILFVSSFW